MNFSTNLTRCNCHCAGPHLPRDRGPVIFQGLSMQMAIRRPTTSWSSDRLWGWFFGSFKVAIAFVLGSRAIKEIKCSMQAIPCGKLCHVLSCHLHHAPQKGSNGPSPLKIFYIYWHNGIFLRQPGLAEEWGFTAHQPPGFRKALLRVFIQLQAYQSWGQSAATVLRPCNSLIVDVGSRVWDADVVLGWASHSAKLVLLTLGLDQSGWQARREAAPATIEWRRHGRKNYFGACACAAFHIPKRKYSRLISQCCCGIDEYLMLKF